MPLKPFPHETQTSNSKSFPSFFKHEKIHDFISCRQNNFLGAFSEQMSGTHNERTFVC